METLDPTVRARLEAIHDPWIQAALTALDAVTQEMTRLQNLPSQLDRAVIRENGKLRGELDAATQALAQERAGLVAAGQSFAKERDDAIAVMQEALTAATQARGPCEVCWTVSWAPTPDGEHCAHCELVAALRATAAECAAATQARAAAEAALRDLATWVSMARMSGALNRAAGYEQPMAVAEALLYGEAAC